MQIIPVIDLFCGQVVHAIKGARHNYQPIQSELTNSSEPLAIVAALLALHPFKQLYIADLNAIQKTDKSYLSNLKIIESIIQNYPALTIWLDPGISNNEELRIWQKLNVRLIVGSESLSHLDQYLSLKFHQGSHILSLDFMPHGYQGPAELLENSEYWPHDVIIMALANVGSNQGANSALMAEMLSRTKGFNLHAAGGIRNIDDLMMLKEMGVQSALVATALHHNQISTEQLAQFAK